MSSNTTGSSATLSRPAGIAQPLQAQFTLTVPDFGSVPGVTHGVAVQHTMDGPKHGPNQPLGLKGGAYQKDRTLGAMTTIRVPADAMLSLQIVPAQGIMYKVIGITFERADSTRPKAVSCSTSNAVEKESPFSALTISGHTIQFRCTPVSRRQLTNPPSASTDGNAYTTYKYSIVIQDTNSGIVGIIDPEIENETPA